MLNFLHFFHISVGLAALLVGLVKPVGCTPELSHVIRAVLLPHIVKTGELGVIRFLVVNVQDVVLFDFHV